jgi:hypothetical protein
MVVPDCQMSFSAEFVYCQQTEKLLLVFSRRQFTHEMKQ